MKMSEKVIWKYELMVADEQGVEMPKGATILTLQVQRGKPCLWVLVSPDAEKEIRTFETFGTGHLYSDHIWEGLKYIGSYQLSDGNFVGHVFERERK